jgi:hypothetical protein
MRVLAAEDGVDLGHVRLPVQRFQVVGHGQQVDLGRQFIGRMAPVGVGEDGELAAVGDGLHLLLYVGEVAGRRVGPVGERLLDIRCFLGIGLERGHNIHPVQRVQVIKVHDVIVHVLLGDHQVANQVGCLGDANAQRILHGADGSKRVNRGAHAAGALGEGPGLARVAPTQDDLDPAHHGARRVGLRDDVVGVRLGFDAQVTLNAGDGVDNYSFGHTILLLYLLIILG